MVAKSYQNLEVVKAPYTSNGREYVQVRLKSGMIKQVRWYTDKEYAKMYGATEEDYREKTRFRSQKDVLGFEKGFITVFRGDTYNVPKEWFKEHGARYTRFWGWFIPSENGVPEEVPFGLDLIRLDWEKVGDGDKLKPDAQVMAAVESIIYEEGNSQYMGHIGDRIEVTVTVDKAIKLDGYYGPSTMHVMKDADENVYVWCTGAKDWAEGTTHHIRGTVKDHKTYKNVKQTVLTRCTEIAK